MTVVSFNLETGKTIEREYTPQEIEARENMQKPTYQQLRAAEYPPIVEYMDGLVKGDVEQMDRYIAACQAVKKKYPK